jgi:hypothetical protein
MFATFSLQKTRIARRVTGGGSQIYACLYMCVSVCVQTRGYLNHVSNTSSSCSTLTACPYKCLRERGTSMSTEQHTWPEHSSEEAQHLACAKASSSLLATTYFVLSCSMRIAR